MILDKKSVNILKALKQNDDILNLDQLSVLKIRPLRYSRSFGIFTKKSSNSSC